MPPVQVVGGINVRGPVGLLEVREVGEEGSQSGENLYWNTCRGKMLCWLLGRRAVKFHDPHRFPIFGYSLQRSGSCHLLGRELGCGGLLQEALVCQPLLLLHC